MSQRVTGDSFWDQFNNFAAFYKSSFLFSKQNQIVSDWLIAQGLTSH